MWMTLAAFIGGISQSISQNMGPTMAAVLISNLVNAGALYLAHKQGTIDQKGRGCSRCGYHHGCPK